MSDWKPGDVARTATSTAFRTATGWTHQDGSVGGLHQDDYERHRPLAVIDPENPEDVKRLADAVLTEGRGYRIDEAIITVGLTRALREFAAPTPPKPTEPTGLGAVVEDADGYLWVSAVNENRRRWYNPIRGGWCDWADVEATGKHSDGVDVSLVPRAQS